jgi:alpha-tubulin suppressor-like RCC1 family protein
MVNFTTLVDEVDTIAPGGYHTLFKTKDQKIWSVGTNLQGQLCTGDTNDHPVPYVIPGLSNIVKTFASSTGSFFLEEQGLLYSCGDLVGHIGSV